MGSATIRGHEDIPRLRALRRARAGRARSRRQGDAARAARIRHRARRGAESKDQRRRHAPLPLRAQADPRRPARRALPGRPVPLEGPRRGAGRRPDDARLALLRRLAPGHRRQRARQRLKRTGLVFFGRTNSCELGLSLTCEPQLYGPTRTPWDLTRISGGSSGGAAAAVGARILPMAHASDGFGSIRAPAACCGLVGLKPTRGRNTFAPYTGEGLGGCSTEHAVTLTVRDCAALLDATAGTGPGDPYAAPAPARPYPAEIGATPGRLRIAWTAKTPNGAKVERESLDALAETVRLCTDLGHDVEAADPEIDGAAVVPTFLTLAAANTVVNLAGHPTGKKAGPSDVERVTWATAQRGERASAADYVRATQTMHRLGRQMAAFHSRYDVLLTPGLATLPPKLGFIDMMLDDVDEYWRRVFHFSPFTVWFNLTGQPAMMLPLGVAGGLPVAVQLVARHGDEATLFRLTAQLETARPWFDRKPALAR